MKVRVLDGIAIVFALLHGAAHAQPLQGTLKTIQQTGTLSIGYREASIPFSYYDGNHDVVGFSHDICLKIIDRIKIRTGRSDLRVKMIPVTSENRIMMVQNGTIDLECGVTTNTEARQQQVAFSDTFFVATTRLLVNKQSHIKDFQDLAGKSVVTNAGTTSERILRLMNAKEKMHMNVISGADYTESFTMLQGGRARAFMMDDVLLAGARTLAKAPSDWVVTGTPQSFEAYGFMLPRDDTPFKRLVDDTMAGMMTSGEMTALYHKWFEQPVPPTGVNFALPMSGRLKALYAHPNDHAMN